MFQGQLPRAFSDYKSSAAKWITLSNGDYYPDILQFACELYKPVLVMFGQILVTSESSTTLLKKINEVPGWMHIQLCRVFKRYGSPQISVEMLKVKKNIDEICREFGPNFRPIQEVQAAYTSRPIPDEAICALLWEVKDRGKKGYDLTEKFFELFQSYFPDFTIKGPIRAGRDILLGDIFPNYPNPKRPVDFLVHKTDSEEVLAVGLARYDSDRGGSQEDDRTGGYKHCADEILQFAHKNNLATKVIFINDGPGLLLGSMWEDYAQLEKSWPGKIIVATLRMVPERITSGWLLV